MENLQTVQKRNGLPQSKALDVYEFKHKYNEITEIIKANDKIDKAALQTVAVEIKKTVQTEIPADILGETVETFSKAGYLDRGNAPTQPMKEALVKGAEALQLPERAEYARQEIYDFLNKQYSTPEINNADNTAIAIAKREVIFSDPFNKLWDKIKTKTRYRITIQGYISILESVKYIDETGENLIKSAFIKTQPTITYTDISTDISDNQQPIVHSDVHTDIHSEILKTLQEHLLILQEQLKVKDKQIEDLENDKRELHEEMKVEREHSRQQADKLAELTRNSQILLKQEQDKHVLLLTEQSSAASS